MRSLAACSSENCDFLAIVESICGLLKFLVVGSQGIGVVLNGYGQRLLRTLTGHDRARDDHDGDRTFDDRRAHCRRENTGKLIGLGNQSAVLTALLVKDFRMSFLKVVVAEFDARDLSRDGEYRHTAAITVEQPVNKVKVPGAATAGTYGQSVGQVRLGACRKRSDFFMPDVDPFDALMGAYGIGERVQGISGYTIHTADAGIEQHLNENLGCFHN